MTDEELIARLRGACYLAFDDWCLSTAPEAADRIEALTKERDQHWDGFVHWRKEADDRSEQLTAARQDAKEAEAYAEELETKLAAAVEALICGRYFHAGEATRAQFIKAYRTAMSEIKGESHE